MIVKPFNARTWLVKELWDLLFHLDDHLKELVHSYGTGTYAILFAIVSARRAW